MTYQTARRRQKHCRQRKHPPQGSPLHRSTPRDHRVLNAAARGQFEFYFLARDHLEIKSLRRAIRFPKRLGRLIQCHHHQNQVRMQVLFPEYFQLI